MSQSSLSKNDVKLFVDTREKKSIIQDFKVNCRALKDKDYFIKTLDCGDFVLELNGNIYAVIERKKKLDLIASVKDGRYKEQVKRLLELKDAGLKVFYLIEGHISSDGYKLIESCITSISLKGLTVIQTRNQQHTCSYLIKFRNSLRKDGGKLQFNEKVLLKKKSKVANDWKRMLLTIPRISIEAVNHLLNLYPNYSLLYRKLLSFNKHESTEKNDKERIKFLKSIKYKSKNGKERNLGPKIANTIHRVSFGRCDAFWKKKKLNDVNKK